MNNKKDFNVLRSLFIVSKIWGLAPFSMTISSRKKMDAIEFHYSQMGRNYTIAILLVLLVLNCVLIVYSSMYISLHWLNAGSTLHVMHLGGSSVALTCTLIMFCSKQKVIVAMGNRLTNLMSVIVRQSHHSWSMLNRKYIGVSLVVIHMVNYIAVTVSSTLIGPVNMHFIIYRIGSSSTIQLLGFFMIQYALLLSYLEGEFANLNEALELLTKLNRKSFLDTSSHVGTASYNDEMRRQLHFIQNARRILCEVAYEASNTFGWPTLMTVTYFCLKLIFDAYIVMGRVLSESSTATTPIILLNLFLIIKDLFPLMVLCIYGTRIIEETGRSSEIVHKVMAHRSAHIASVKYQLQQFSIELLHQGEVSFTACGFFLIDGSLLKAIISTTITYMIILLPYVQKT